MKRFTFVRSTTMGLLGLATVGCAGWFGEGSHRSDDHELPSNTRKVSVVYVNSSYYESAHMDAGATIAEESANLVAPSSSRTEDVLFTFASRSFPQDFSFCATRPGGTPVSVPLSLTYSSAGSATRIRVTWNGDGLVVVREGP